MKVKNYKITDLKFSEYNPRQLTEPQYEALKASLEKFGLQDPIIINVHQKRKNVIIGGHQRVRVWGDLGNKVVPCVEVSLTKNDEREFNIRLNANTGEWDFDTLANNFDAPELADWGFDENLLEKLLCEGEEESSPGEASNNETGGEETVCPECGHRF